MTNDVQGGNQEQLDRTEAVARVKLSDPYDIRCQFCMGQSFRRARPRSGDLISLLRMRFPVRCMRCGQLQAVNFLVGALAGPPVAKEAKLVGNGALPTPAVLHDFALQRQGMTPSVEDRAALPRKQLMDPYDLRCQYCPGQAFRRSRLRARDLLQIARMHYTARCLRCGQRQSVSFLVAAAAVPSHYKQARTMRNTETWREFTQGPEQGPGRDAFPESLPPPVVSEVYALKDAPRRGREDVGPASAQEYKLKDSSPARQAVPSAVRPQAAGAKAAESAAASVPAKKPVDDQAIW